MKVTDKQVEDYYAKNKAQYSQPESREVRHILVKTRAQANGLYDQLKAGGDFRRAGEEVLGGHRFEGERGQVDDLAGADGGAVRSDRVPVEEERISRPVKTEFGYHIIQPIGDVKEAKVTPLKDVKDSINQQLAQTKKNEAMTKWVEG